MCRYHYLFAVAFTVLLIRLLPTPESGSVGATRTASLSGAEEFSLKQADNSAEGDCDDDRLNGAASERKISAHTANAVAVGTGSNRMHTLRSRADGVAHHNIFVSSADVGCTDHAGIIKYLTKSPHHLKTTCRRLARKASRRITIAKRCGWKLFKMDGYGIGARVGDACPVACRQSCDDDGDSPGGLSPDDPGEDNGYGKWGPTYSMKLIPIHAMFLPDGNVLSYGTNTKGQQRADLYYQVWNTAKGAVKSTHKLLQHYTEADIFCSTINVDPSTGNAIIIGGDIRTPEGFGINTVLEFNWKTYEVRRHPLGDMHYARWYGTSINLPNGNIFVIGGKSGDLEDAGSPIPELWSPESGFRSLDGAEVPAIANDLKNKGHWWYPYCYVNSEGEIICIMPSRVNADVYRVGVEGDGSIEKIGTKPFRARKLNPSIMFRTDQVLFLDDDGGLWVADVSGEAPAWTKKLDLGSTRTNGCFVIMPDGRVAIVGGANTFKDQGSSLERANYTIDIWDPTTNEVHAGPSQEIARLYHSTALILLDGSVLSQGGGAPGPLKNRNGQIYFPDYLFGEDQEEVGDARPSILACPRNVLTDGSFLIAVGDASAVDKVTVTKSGASTHSRNFDTRWLDLEFEALDGNVVQVFTEGKNTMIPGLWMLSTIDASGVPSVASLLGVDMAQI